MTKIPLHPAQARYLEELQGRYEAAKRELEAARSAIVLGSGQTEGVVHLFLAGDDPHIRIDKAPPAPEPSEDS